MTHKTKTKIWFFSLTGLFHAAFCWFCSNLKQACNLWCHKSITQANSKACSLLSDNQIPDLVGKKHCQNALTLAAPFLLLAHKWWLQCSCYPTTPNQLVITMAQPSTTQHCETAPHSLLRYYTITGICSLSENFRSSDPVRGHYGLKHLYPAWPFWVSLDMILLP